MSDRGDRDVEPDPGRPFAVSEAEYPFDSQWLETDGGSLHYVDEGSGPAVLFLHGNPTWSYLYREPMRALRSSVRAIALDYPGFGFSGAPADYRFRPRDHARWVDRLIGRLGVDRFVLVAHDWGGPIGLSVAAARPERVAGVVLTNTWCWRPTGRLAAFSLLAGGRWTRPLYRWAHPFARCLLPLGLRPDRRRSRVLRAYRIPFAERSRWEETGDSDSPPWVLARSIRTERSWIEEVGGQLGDLADVPVQLVWGARDPVLGSRQVRNRWGRLLPRSHVRVLGDAGHYVPEDRPDAVAEAVRTVLRR